MFGPIYGGDYAWRVDGSVQEQYRLGDLLANSITHGVGAVFAIAGAAYLIAVATRGNAWHVVSCSIYAGALVLVYVCSTLYHSLVRTRAQHVFQVLDHSAIYVLIAGTYTPFTLVSLHGRLGWALFGVVWGLAILGVVFKSVATGRFEIASALIYLFMGWFIVIAARPLIHAISWHGVMWIAAGGLAYTAGIAFFAFDRLRYFHALWHVFVLAGSVAHYFAVLFYVVPARA
jgi:hemolysin III